MIMLYMRFVSIFICHINITSEDEMRWRQYNVRQQLKQRKAKLDF